MLPVTEQRLSIPYFILYENLYWLKVVLISMIGNITIGVIIYILFAPLLHYLSKFKYLNVAINMIFEKSRKRMQFSKSRSKALGLILFIGIPLPFTGVWTGAIGAYLLNLSKRSVILSMIIGVLISGIIVSMLTVLGNEIWVSIVESAINKKFGIK